MSVTAAQKRRKVLIAAVAAVVATGVFVYALSTAGKPLATASTTGVPTTSVVAVNSDIPVNTKLTAANLKTVQVPTAQLTTDNVTKSEQAVGRVTLVPLASGTILLTSELVADFVNPDSIKLHAGDVAVAIPFDEAKGFGGFIQPEDRFDILCDSGNNQPAYYCFNNVRVLEVGKRSQQPTPAPPAAGIALSGTASPAASAPAQVNGASVVVVEMSRNDAALLNGVLAHQPPTGQGTIVAYVLRSRADSNTSPPP